MRVSSFNIVCYESTTKEETFFSTFLFFPYSLKLLKYLCSVNDSIIFVTLRSSLQIVIGCFLSLAGDLFLLHFFQFDRKCFFNDCMFMQKACRLKIFVLFQDRSKTLPFWWLIHMLVEWRRFSKWVWWINNIIK